MVVTMAWSQSWIAVSISLVVLAVLILLLLLCACFEKTNTNAKHYYVLDENGFKKLDADDGDAVENGFFRRLSHAGVLRTNFVFSTALNMCTKAETAHEANDNNIEQHVKTIEKELLDSFDADKQFSNSVLKMMEDDCERTYLDVDDWKSCISEGSCHPSRKSSAAETIFSTTSELDGFHSFF